MVELAQGGAATAALAAVEAAARAGDWAQGVKLAQDALAQGLEHPKLLQMRAIGCERQGRLAEALADLGRARDMDPSDVGVALALGVLLLRVKQHARAASLFETLVETEPNNPVLNFYLGQARFGDDDYAGARRSFERVTALDPTAADAFGKLALLAAHRGDSASAETLAQTALSLKPGNQDARRVLVEAAIDQGRLGEAEDLARRWLSETGGDQSARVHAYSLLGDALDGLGRAPEAFSAYQKGNAIFRQLNAEARQPLPALLHNMRNDVDAVSAEAWSGGSQTPTTGPARAHVFLLGFMRSGTTLLEQALSRHEAVANLEETEALAAAAHLLSRPGGMAYLSRLRADEAETYREAYWRAVRDAGVQPDGKVFIDKLPFNGAKLPLIHALFPDAKIILALRDPRDVVLSCFQRRLRPNAYTYELADPEDGARLYDAYMGFVRACRRRLPLSLVQCRHEDLVADFTGQMRMLCDFLGLDFTPDMAGFDAAAAADKVMSQTARQLQGGLSNRGVGRWRAYADELRPALAVLSPWIETFGYAPNASPAHATG